MKNSYKLFMVLMLFNCKNEAKVDIKVLSANEIINKSIEVAGDKKFDKSVISFNFREINYVAERDSGRFRLTRFQIDKNNDSILDVLNNTGFQRFVNQELVSVADSMIIRYKASVNSVHYFSVLPYGLNDKAANKKLLGEEQITGNDYYIIEVTFNQEGGGEDYEDVFIYWINKVTFKPDYLAYSYNEDDGQGMRFREAYNERYVKGLRFVDYYNYKSENAEIRLKDLAKAFEDKELKLLSTIELEDIEVNLIDL